MSDAVTVVITVGAPQNPAVAVSRSETIVVESQDRESVAIEALRMVDRLCTDVRAEALRQTRVVMEGEKAREGDASRSR